MIAFMRWAESEDCIMEIETLSDAELIALYNSTEPDSPDVDRIANEIEARGLDL